MAQHSKYPRDAVILGSARTPQGKFLGALSSLTATDVNEVILCNVVSAEVVQALPRQVSIGAGVPASVAVELES